MPNYHSSLYEYLPLSQQLSLYGSEPMTNLGLAFLKNVLSTQQLLSSIDWESYNDNLLLCKKKDDVSRGGE